MYVYNSFSLTQGMKKFADKNFANESGWQIFQFVTLGGGEGGTHCAVSTIDQEIFIVSVRHEN